MANVQFGTYSPTEDPKDSTRYVYYTRRGEYLGGTTGSAKIFTTDREKYEAAAAASKWEDINDETFLVKYDEKALSHSDFRYISYIVHHESGETDIRELRCIAFTSYNRSETTKRTWRALLASGYSSVPSKQELADENDEKSKLARYAVLDVLHGLEDLTNGAEFWDGTDFLAWGNSEQNPYNKLGQNKFDEYKFIEIPKAIYDDFLAAQGVTSTTYGDSGNHNTQNDPGTHEHVTVKDRRGREKAKIRYQIPAADFEDQQYWTSGSFYYETGVRTPNGISATITAGKSIFWKITPTRLTSATPQQGGQPQPGQPQPAQQPGQPQQPGQQRPGQPQQPGQQRPGQPQHPGQQRPGQPQQPGQQRPGQPQQPGQRPGPPQPGQPQGPGQGQEPGRPQPPPRRAP
ncbi:hypothetical protein [Pedobacter yulinensis]|uniref:hypothetical protein n=1 Tax=Pedobacter yulinensis TaxID=2126353 RepID=UPI00195511CE|nr:hypothetical protein [Pedobacter yulinensis]